MRFDHGQQQKSKDSMNTNRETVSNSDPNDARMVEATGDESTASDFPAQTGVSLKECSKLVCAGAGPHNKQNYLDLAGLIRSIQRAEGNIDCFQRKDDCDRQDCSWRSYCLDWSNPRG
jgi:hypothetical protein